MTRNEECLRNIDRLERAAVQALQQQCEEFRQKLIQRVSQKNARASYAGKRREAQPPPAARFFSSVR